MKSVGPWLLSFRQLGKEFDYAKNLRAHKNRINGVHISHEPYQTQFGLVEINF